MLKDHKAEAQKVLDELWNERLTPFPLTVGQITTDEFEQTLHFNDSRMRTARISLSEDRPFTEGVRAAVLKRVARLTGPLADWNPGKTTTAKGKS
jgi:hypothetical protein